MPNNKGYRRQLTPLDRRAIKARYLSGVDVASLAEEFSCASSTIYLVTRGLPSTRHLADVRRAVGTFNAISDIDHGWVAGIIDGEGWIGLAHLRRGVYAPRVTVAATTPSMPRRLQHLCGGHVCTKKGRANNRDTACWDLWSLSSVAAFCAWVFPALVVKHQQAELLAEYCHARILSGQRPYTAREVEIAALLKKLNRRGVQ